MRRPQRRPPKRNWNSAGTRKKRPAKRWVAVHPKCRTRNKPGPLQRINATSPTRRAGSCRMAHAKGALFKPIMFRSQWTVRHKSSWPPRLPSRPTTSSNWRPCWSGCRRTWGSNHWLLPPTLLLHVSDPLKTYFFEHGRVGLLGEAHLVAQVVQVAIRDRLLQEFFNDGFEVGQGANARQRWYVWRPGRATEASQQKSGLNHGQGHTAIEPAMSVPPILSTGAQGRVGQVYKERQDRGDIQCRVGCRIQQRRGGSHFFLRRAAVSCSLSRTR